ncbi:MAG TPA: DUF488 domain-containing protein, partial [Blastocatellia bacterium]|nr:DUF488 domain-containing protein [Blastocatellia bacterium]
MALFSVGHSNVDIDAFISLLERNGIEVLVDTRSQPYSRYLPHFNQSALKKAVTEAGIEYCYMGDTLGGRPEDPRFYFESGKVDYDLLATADYYVAGIDALIE